MCGVARPNAVGFAKPIGTDFGILVPSSDGLHLVASLFLGKDFKIGEDLAAEFGSKSNLYYVEDLTWTLNTTGFSIGTPSFRVPLSCSIIVIFGECK